MPEPSSSTQTGDAPAQTVTPLDQCSATQRRLLETLLHNPSGMYAHELVAALGVTATAVRQHLAALERAGLISSESVASGRGRPRHYYGLTRAGREAFPRRYDALAASMVTELAQQLGDDQLPRAMRRMGRRTAKDLGQPASLSVSGVAEVMLQLGYAAHGETAADGSDEIVAMNCVFHRLAQEQPAVCEFDLEFMRTATGRSVEHRQCMVRGDTCCRFKFSSTEKQGE